MRKVQLQLEALDSESLKQSRVCFHNISLHMLSVLGKSFRQEQCEVRNGPQTDPKGVKTFVEWVPKFAGVLPKDMCKLTCRAKGTGYYVVFAQRVSESPEVLYIR